MMDPGMSVRKDTENPCRHRDVRYKIHRLVCQIISKALGKDSGIRQEINVPCVYYFSYLNDGKNK